MVTELLCLLVIFILLTFSKSASKISMKLDKFLHFGFGKRGFVEKNFQNL